MKLPRLLFGVPLHALLVVHFPITLWLMTPALDVAALYIGPEPWWTLALWATALGVLTGVVAIATGLLEYLEPSVAGVDMRLAARHAVRTTLALGVFGMKILFVAAYARVDTGAILICLALDLLGCVLLVQGVYFGAKQVYGQLEKQ